MTIVNVKMGEFLNVVLTETIQAETINKFFPATCPGDSLQAIQTLKDLIDKIKSDFPELTANDLEYIDQLNAAFKNFVDYIKAAIKADVPVDQTEYKQKIELFLLAFSEIVVSLNQRIVMQPLQELLAKRAMSAAELAIRCEILGNAPAVESLQTFIVTVMRNTRATADHEALKAELLKPFEPTKEQNEIQALLVDLQRKALLVNKALFPVQNGITSVLNQAYGSKSLLFGFSALSVAVTIVAGSAALAYGVKIRP